jgi:hypothetical protein
VAQGIGLILLLPFLKACLLFLSIGTLALPEEDVSPRLVTFAYPDSASCHQVFFSLAPSLLFDLLGR